MIIKGYVQNIHCYTGQVYIGSKIGFIRKGNAIVAICNNKSIGELDPITRALLELYYPFMAKIAAIATNLHDGYKYPIQIKIDFL
jgi:hypothetical protein